MSGQEFLNTFEEMFGVITDEMCNISNINEDYSDLMHLVNNANIAFEKESLNVEPIHIRNVDNFMHNYKKSIFRTKKSIKIISKRVTIIKNIKKILKVEVKQLMNNFEKKMKNEK